MPPRGCCQRAVPGARERSFALLGGARGVAAAVLKSGFQAGKGLDPALRTC